MKKELLRILKVICASFALYLLYALSLLCLQVEFNAIGNTLPFAFFKFLLIGVGSLGVVFLPLKIWNKLKLMKPRSRTWLLGAILFVYLYEPTPTLTLKEEAYIQEFVSNRLNSGSLNDFLEEGFGVPISDLVKLKMLMVRLRMPQSSHISIDDSNGYWTLYFMHWRRVFFSTKRKECYITNQIDKNWVIEDRAGKVKHYTKRDALFVVKHKS